MLRDNLVGLIEPMLSSAGAYPLALCTARQKPSDDRPLCLENPRPEGAESTLTENAASPFHAEPKHNPDAGVWSRAKRALAMFIPPTTITNDPVPKEEMGNATSLFNLMRNIGASIGIATVTTIVARHQQVYTNVLGEYVNPFSQQAQTMLQGVRAVLMAGGADAVSATQQAYATVFGMVQQQAVIMSFNDAFWLLMVIYCGGLLLP